VLATYAKEEVVEEAPAVVEGAVVAEAEGAEPELSVERGKKEEAGTEEGAKPEEKEKEKEKKK